MTWTHLRCRYTDLVVAGSKGIGFYNCAKIDKEPTVVDALQGISFKQVVCSEFGAVGKPQSIINTLAVSDDGNLYFVEGSRTYKGNTIKLECSGIPIRFDANMISAQFSGAMDAIDPLSAPIRRISLPKHNNEDTIPVYEVHTNQRIQHRLSNQPSTEDLRSSRDSHGNMLFDSKADFVGQGATSKPQLSVYGC